MNAYVICCNDSVEYVVLDDANRAREKMLELEDAFFKRSRGLFLSREHYENLCHWRVCTARYEAGAARKEGV